MKSMEGKRILVTGGAGFIASHIVDRFIAAGAEVLIIDNLVTGEKRNLNPQARFCELDIVTQAAQDELVRFSPEIIIHAAAQISVRVSMEDPVLDTSTNLVGLVNLLQGVNRLTTVANSTGAPFIVLLSTGGAIYGEKAHLPTPESEPAIPTSVYGLAKRCSELYLDLWSREFGLAFAALRLGNVYGPRQSPHGEAGVVAIFCQKLLAGQQPIINGTGEQTRDFVFVDDVAGSVFKVAESQVSGIYNIGTAEESSVNLIYKNIADALSAFQDLPTAARQAVLNGPKFGPAKLGEQLRSCISYKLAQQSFGYAPQVSLSQGIARTVEWFIEQTVQ